MKIDTRIFGEMDIAEDKVIHIVNGLVGFPEMTDFALVHDEEKGVNNIQWLQSIQEPHFAMPVISPHLLMEEYNPRVEEEYLRPLGELNAENMLLLVTITIPAGRVEEMTANLKGPLVINAVEKKAYQVIADNPEYQVKFPIYDILKAGKEGE